MVNKLKRFFQVVWHSAIDFPYYKDIFQAPFSFSLKYLFVLLFLVNLIAGIFFAQKLSTLIPRIPTIVNDIKIMAKEFFPDDLVITINNGKIRTNVDEPYFIKLPKKWSTTDNKEFSHFITIDTKANVEDIKKYKTVMLITKSNIVIVDKDTGYRVQTLDQIKGYYQIDKYIYNNILKKLFPYLNYLTIVIYVLMIITIIIFPVLAVFFVLSGKFFYLLFFCLILLFISKLMKTKLGYRKIFQLSLHGLTVPIILSTISGWFNFSLPDFSSTLIFLLFMSVVVSQFKERVTASV